jgi:hypothetical protein
MHFFRLISICFILVFLFGFEIIAFTQTYLSGYEKALHGEEISYHAPDPRVKKALLVRSQDSSKSIEWETVPIPADYSHESISFIWLFGMDASSEKHAFTLSANGQKLLGFSNPEIANKGDVTIEGGDGVILRFRTTKIDRHRDVMGYAILTMPSAKVTPGETVRFKVQGESAGSNIWYMTFQLPVKKEIIVRPQNLLVNQQGKKMQALLVEMVSLHENNRVSLSIDGRSPEKFDLEPGYNALQYLVPEVKVRKDISLSITIDQEEEVTQMCTLEPVKPWTIYLVQHTHTDIGYTRPQSEILPEHLRFIDYALDYCDLTDDYPEDSKFRWTCESAWPVEQYLIRRPENQVKRLLKRIEEGRIEVTAMLFNMSEIADETALKNMIQPIRLFHQMGIPVRTAMQDDVNGIGWCMADYLPDAGVKYLIMGEHGHRALIPFDMPTSFWWLSPSGKKMLAFRGEHYMHANSLLLHTGDLDNFRSNLLRYLEELEDNGYPFNHLALQYSGYVTDNSPPALTPNKVIKAWNERYVWPKLRSATASEFMQYIETNHGTELESIQKAWPDWWTDGFGSAARETAAAREAQTEMNITTALLSMSSVLGSDIKPRIHQDIEAIYKNILFYDEHTFGAAESISNPYSENSMEQWAEKSSYAWEALKQSRILREEAFGLLHEHIPRYSTPSITVFNTLNQVRSGPVVLYIDHEILDPGSEFSIKDSSGSLIPAQPVSSRSDGTYWVLWVNDVPAMGYTSLQIQEGGDRVSLDNNSFSGDFENEFWSARINPEDGSFASLFHKRLKKELTDPESQWKPGQVIYERLTDRHQLELFTLREVPKRTSLTNIAFRPLEDGPIWTTLSFTGFLEGCASGPIEMEYRFYKSEPFIEMTYRMVKNPVTDPEALYVAFPFKKERAEIIFDAQGGVVRPGLDQIAGTASDWNTVQNFVSVRSEDGQILLASPEIPLFHLGGLNLGKFSYHHQPETNHVYSWVLNNYWTTNFKASQEGSLTWRYLVTFMEDPDLAKANAFGWNARIPLIGRVFTEGTENNKPPSSSIISLDTPNILLVNAVPSVSFKGIILQLRETAGQQTELDLNTLSAYLPDPDFYEVNAIGEDSDIVTGTFIFEPNSVHFLKIIWNE